MQKGILETKERKLADSQRETSIGLEVIESMQTLSSLGCL
jgi:hypothetical protein